MNANLEVDKFIHEQILILDGITGVAEGKKYVASSGAVTIGRNAKSNLIVLDEVSVSKNHTKITYNAKEKEFSVMDVGSTNGTFVAIREAFPITNGMEIQSGGDLFKVESLDNAKAKCHLLGVQGEFVKKKILFGDKGLIVGKTVREGPDYKTEPTDRSSFFYSKNQFYIKDLSNQIKTWYRLSPEKKESPQVPISKGAYLKIGDTSVFFVRGYDENTDADIKTDIYEAFSGNLDTVNLNHKMQTVTGGSPVGKAKAPSSNHLICRVCKSKPARYCAIPCGHLVYCEDCKGKTSKCPDVGCEENVDDVMTVIQKLKFDNEGSPVEKARSPSKNHLICRVCKNKPAIYCAIPCGHLVYCEDCKGKTSKCPDFGCEENVDDVMTVLQKPEFDSGGFPVGKAKAPTKIQLMCRVCKNKPAIYCAIPCGHLVYCEDCKGKASKCPEIGCEEIVEDFMTVLQKKPDLT